MSYIHDKPYTKKFPTLLVSKAPFSKRLAHCRSCQKSIEPLEIRVKISYDVTVQYNQRVGPPSFYMHFSCLMQAPVDYTNKYASDQDAFRDTNFIKVFPCFSMNQITLLNDNDNEDKDNRWYEVIQNQLVKWIRSNTNVLDGKHTYPKQQSCLNSMTSESKSLNTNIDNYVLLSPIASQITQARPVSVNLKRHLDRETPVDCNGSNSQLECTDTDVQSNHDIVGFRVNSKRAKIMDETKYSMETTNAELMSDVEPSRWMSIGKAADLLGLTTSRLRKLCDCNTVKCMVTQGGHRTVDVEDVKLYLKSLFVSNQYTTSTFKFRNCFFTIGETKDEIAIKMKILSEYYPGENITISSNLQDNKNSSKTIQDLKRDMIKTVLSKYVFTRKINRLIVVSKKDLCDTAEEYEWVKMLCEIHNVVILEHSVNSN